MNTNEIEQLQKEIESSKAIIIAAENVIRKELQKNVTSRDIFEYEVLKVRQNGEHSICTTINTYKNVEDALKLVNVLQEIELQNSDQIFYRYRVSAVKKI